MFLIAAMLGVHLALGPYDGPPLPGSIPDTVKFAVRVRGAAGAPVRLRAVGVPRGYIASFCTPRVCSRDRVDLVVGLSGRERIELQFIKNEATALAPTRVKVEAAGAPRVSVAFALGRR